jgi:hypothetical protein
MKLTPASTTASARKLAPNKLVRTDAAARTLDTMFSTLPRTQSQVDDEGRMSKRRKGDTSDENLAASNGSSPDKGKGRIKVSGCKLNSVQELRKDATARSDTGKSRLQI